LNLTAREEHKLRVSENKVLRRIFKAERNRNGKRKTEKELSYMYYSTDIINLIKSGRMRGVVYVTRIGEINTSAYKFKLKNVKC
jgi:hypothetical protein